MSDVDRSTRTIRITSVVVLLTSVGLAAGWFIMRPETFSQRVLTFALGVALAGMMLAAIERFSADAAHESLLENEFDRLDDGEHPAAGTLSKVPPPPTVEQWERLQRERGSSRD